MSIPRKHLKYLTISSVALIEVIDTSKTDPTENEGCNTGEEDAERGIWRRQFNLDNILIFISAICHIHIIITKMAWDI